MEAEFVARSSRAVAEGYSTDGAVERMPDDPATGPPPSRVDALLVSADSPTEETGPNSGGDAAAESQSPWPLVPSPTPPTPGLSAAAAKPSRRTGPLFLIRTDAPPDFSALLR